MNSGALTNILFIGVLLAGMYFLLVRPQQQRAKKHAEMLAAIVPGSRVVTVGGLVATVLEVGKESVVLDAGDGVELEYVRDSIGRVLSDTEFREFFVEVPAEETDADASSDAAAGDVAEGEGADE